MDYATLALDDTMTFKHDFYGTHGLMQQQDNTAYIQIDNQFGTFALEEKNLLTFTGGIIGLDKFAKFGMTTFPGSDAKANAFRLLLSVDDANLAFVVMPTTIDKALLAKEDLYDIMNVFSIKPEHLLVMHIVTVREGENNTPEMTLNLRAPLIIDTSNLSGVQHIMTGDKYSVQYPLNL